MENLFFFCDKELKFFSYFQLKISNNNDFISAKGLMFWNRINSAKAISDHSITLMVSVIYVLEIHNINPHTLG